MSIDDKNITPDNQFGFRAGHDTVHAASFDTVWLEALFYKLYRLGIGQVEDQLPEM